MSGKNGVFNVPIPPASDFLEKLIGSLIFHFPRNPSFSARSFKPIFHHGIHVQRVQA
jgi:hypothetical protein